MRGTAKRNLFKRRDGSFAGINLRCSLIKKKKAARKSRFLHQRKRITKRRKLMVTLRPYQQDAVCAIKKALLNTVAPICIEAATGSGKSLLVADIAHWTHQKSGKGVLCLAPSKELVEQNHEKYLLTGEPASFYSASVGIKSLRHPVVFGTPKTVLNNIDKMSGKFACVIVDECFTPETQIQTRNGKFRISDPAIIDQEIACFNESTGDILYHKPIRVWTSGTKNVSFLKTKCGKEVKCTNTHKFYIDGSWIAAKDIKPGQKMILLDSQTCVPKKLLRALVAVVKKLIQCLIRM